MARVATAIEVGTRYLDYKGCKPQTEYHLLDPLTSCEAMLLSVSDKS